MTEDQAREIAEERLNREGESRSATPVYNPLGGCNAWVVWFDDDAELVNDE